MAKKPKKSRKARAVQQLRASYKPIPQLGLKQRKRLIADTLELMVSKSRPKDQAAIAEHIVDIGIELLGLAYGVDSNSAMLVFPDDDVSRLIMSIDQHERATGVSCTETIEALISKLGEHQSLQAKLN